MSKKGTRSILILLISFLFLFGCPFTISADNTIVPTFAGTTSQTDWNNAGGHLTEYHESSSSNTGISKLNFSFNNHYYGIVSITYYFGSSTYSYGDVFIADGYGEFYYRNSSGTYNYVTAVRIDMVNLVIPDSNVDLSQIITLLTAIQGNTSNTVLEIQNVLDELIISNGYLETISKMRQWNFPLESFPFNYQLLTNTYAEVVDIVQYNNWTYPVFKFDSGDNVIDIWYDNGFTYYIIMYVNKNINNATQFLDMFNISSNSTLMRFERLTIVASGENLIKVTIRSNLGHKFIMSSKVDNLRVVGFYHNRDTYRNISSDFALNFGLRNELLDNLNIIANGTTQSNSAAGSNDAATNQFEDVAGDMYDYEDSFNSDMNSSLNQIDTNFNIGSQFGSKFSASAQWVSQQFNTLTASTPFGSVISFSLLLGLALLIIGKVLR